MSNSDDPFETAMRRMLLAVGASSDSELAKALGITHQSISSARKRRAFPPAWTASISQHYNISADWLLYGEGNMHRQAQDDPDDPPGNNRTPGNPGNRVNPGPLNRPQPAYAQPHDHAAGYQIQHTHLAGELVLLPKVLPRLDTATGRLERAGGPPPLAFQHYWLSARGQIRHMVVLDMPGEHMHPTISRGDALLVDLSQTEVLSGDFYLLAFGETVTVMRVDRIPGKLRLLSDNPAHPPHIVDLPLRDAQVLGRILWCGKPLS